jgi:uncharacterized protein with GYD domain
MVDITPAPFKPSRAERGSHHRYDPVAKLLTDQGRKGIKEVPNRQDKSRETAKQFGVERKTVWMTFGPYDFVHVYEAPNDEAMAKFVMTLASFGNVRTTVMRAWDESEHLALIRELS